jgi:hypothetical protein
MTIRWLQCAFAVGLSVLVGPVCSGTGVPGEVLGPVLDPKTSGESATSSAANPAPLPSSACPSQKAVPERPCAADDQCGEDGFCDRDRCAQVSSFKHSYGWSCGTSDDCVNLPCIDGRCRSCRSDVECEQRRELIDPRCLVNRATPGTRSCTNGIPSLAGGIGPRPPPRR